MAFLDKVKNLFAKKDEVPVKEVKKVVGKPKKKRNGEGFDKANDENVFEKSVEKSELFEILNSVAIDYSYLALDRIQSEAETISNYVRGILKDLEAYQIDTSNKERVEDAIRGIGRKIKLVAMHSLELKNLLANLENHYYAPVIDALRKLNKKVDKNEIAEIIGRIERDRNLVTDLDTNITRVVGYDALFNPDKNPQYREEIEEEARKRLVHGELRELLDLILTAASDKTLSIKANIENFNPLEAAKKFV